jgi:biopolymer transport protein ExbD
MNSLLMRQRRSAHKRAHKAVVTLNLVSLTDFFTILLVFLLVHTSAPELLERNASVVLPDSVSEQLPSQRVVITVNSEVVTVEGNPVVRLSAEEGNEGVIAPLASVLAAEGARQGPVPEGGRLVTIMGDRDIPYTLLKRIMLTCQESDFAKISLAVNKLEKKPSDNEVRSQHLVAAAGGSQ